MKKINKFIGIILTIVLICAMNVSVYASSNALQGELDNTNYVDENYAEVVANNAARGNILNRVVGRISNNGNGSVNVYGAVYGSVVCDKLILEMTLQKKVNGSWQNVKSFSASANSQGFYTKSYNVSVTKGYYYRLKLAGVAIKNGVSESQAPVTDGILIK